METYGYKWTEVLAITGVKFSNGVWKTPGGTVFYSVQQVFDAMKFGIPKSNTVVWPGYKSENSIKETENQNPDKPKEMTIEEATDYLGPIEYRQHLFKIKGIKTPLTHAQVIEYAVEVKNAREARNG